MRSSSSSSCVTKYTSLRTSEDSRPFRAKIRESQGTCRRRTAHAIPPDAHTAHANVVANVVAGGSAEKRCTWIDELAFLPRARVPVACAYPAHAFAKHIHARAHSVLITLMLCMPSPVLGVLSLPSARSHVWIRGPHDGNAWARAAAEGRTAATLAHAVL